MAGFYDESISNGTGWRAVLFVSGCPHNCPGCHNKIAQDYNYGEEFNETKIINRIKENSILNGITISGGEPLCPQNIKEVNKFIEDVKKEIENLAMKYKNQIKVKYSFSEKDKNMSGKE